MIIPPKVNGKWILREDKFNGEQQREIAPYTAPLLLALINREIPDITIGLIEAQRDNLSHAEVKSKVEMENPGLIITFLSWGHIPWDRKCAEFDYPTIAILLQQTVSRYEMQKRYNLKTKYICKHEIEYPVVEAIREFKQIGNIESTRGFIINENNKLSDTGNADKYNLELLPMPDYETFAIEKYFALRDANATIKKEHVKSVMLNTMKGCLYNCTYCGGAKRNMGVRCQSDKQVVNQIEHLYKTYNVKHYSYIDNEFVVNIRRAKNICRQIINKKLDIKWLINNRVELFDDELIDLLKRAGCVNVRLGIETADPKLQKYINKEIDLEKAKVTIQKLKNAGLTVHMYFTPGIPGETKESLRLNARFIADTEPDTISTGPLFLMPGSIMYDKLKSENKIIENDWTEYKNPRKLTFINESYNNMHEIKLAEMYMHRKLNKYLFLKYIKKGIVKFNHIVLWVSNIYPIHKAVGIMPGMVRGKIYRLIFK